MRLPSFELLRQSSLPLFLWAVLVAIGLEVPGSALPGSPESVDRELLANVAHFVFFFAMTVLATLRFGWHRRWLILGGSIVYGLALELLQTVVPDRTVRVADLVVNLLGAVLGLLLVYVRERSSYTRN